MTNTTVTSVPVSFDDVGRGEPALVYLTGWYSTRTSYAAMVEHTARHVRFIAIDWRVHGTSPARVPGRAGDLRPQQPVVHRPPLAPPSTGANGP